MSEAVENQEAQDGSVVSSSKRRPLLMTLASGVLIALLFYVAYDFFVGSRSVSTDNAYVGGDVAQVTPLTSGKVAEVLVSDTQAVKRGQVLFRLDDSDQQIALRQAEAALAMAQRRYGQSLAQGDALDASATAASAAIPEAQARLASASAALDKARADYSRRSALVSSGAVSADEVTSARNALEAAKAGLAEARAGLGQAQANAASARQSEAATRALTAGTSRENAPEVLAAKANLAKAKLDFERTVVRAPVDGIVAKRAVQVGQKVEAGSVAMAIVPVSQLYVDANFKEDQLGKVRPGQAAELHSDFYGSDVTFHGKVLGFAGGTGAAFSLIPAQNATGNWIKIVQRLPVRIKLDPRELQEHPLRIGLSMDAEIELSDAE